MATGDVISAAVEPNGWVAAIRIQGSPGSYATSPDTAATNTSNFAAYPAAKVVSYGSAILAVGGAYSFTLTGQSNGYIQSGGTAVASSTVARTFLGTKPLRKPVEATAAGVRSAKRVDETDNGDGTFTVRIALSQHAYSTDTGLSLTVLAGWRTGSPAQTISVTNNSTVVAPQPLVRWADVPYQLQEGSFNLEVVVVSLHPVGVQPVAGVKFTVTDGTTIKSYWALALSASVAPYTTSGSGAAATQARVYQAPVDPTTATALTKGLLRCDHEVYPWVGTARLSDPAGTKSMTGLGTASFVTTAQQPFVVAYNAGATGWITPRVAYVVADGSGASTASAGLVSLASAPNASLTCNSVNIAHESLRLHAVANTGVGTIAAANGQAAITASTDGCRIRLKAGTGAHAGMGTAAVGSGVQQLATWLVIEGDPADSNPRANVVLRTPAAANGTSRVTRMRLTKLSSEFSLTNPIATAANVWLDDTEDRAVSGSETTVVPVPFSASGNTYLTNSRWWKTAQSLTKSGTQIPMLIRNCEVERAICAPLLINNRRLSTAVSGTQGIAQEGSPTSPSVDAGRGLDRIAVGNDMRYINSNNGAVFSFLANANAPAAPAPGNALGTTYPVASRQAFINNIFELYGTTFPVILPVGENNPAAMTETVVEGNTLVGDRWNADYNDLNMATVALNDTADTVSLNNRRANNVGMKIANKQDRYNDGAVSTQRTGVTLASTRSKLYNTVGTQVTISGSPASIYEVTVAGTTASTGGPTGTGTAITDGGVTWKFIATENRQHGYRPNAISAWSMSYGVNSHGNIDMQSTDDSTSDPEFFYEFIGLGSQQLAAEGVVISATPFTNDKSGTTQRLNYQAAPDGTGGGNYQPLRTTSGNYIIGRGRNANTDVDMAGVARGAVFSAGALEGLAPTALAPGAGSVALAGSVPSVLAAAGAVTVSATLALLTGAAVLLGQAVITPANGAIAILGSAPGVFAAARFVGSTGVLAFTGTAAVLTVGAGSVSIVPAAGGIALAGTAGALLAAGAINPDAAGFAIAGSSAWVVAQSLLRPSSSSMALATGGGELTVAGQLIRIADGVRLDRLLDLSVDDDQAAFIGGLAGAAWYRVHRLGVWTIDLVATDDVLLGVNWAGRFALPVTATATVSDGDGLTASVVAVSLDRVVLRVTGGSGTIRLAVTSGAVPEADHLDLRVRVR